MRYLCVIVLILTACARGEHTCSIPDDRQQATSTNDRARRAMHPELSNTGYDSLAVRECYTVPK